MTRRDPSLLHSFLGVAPIHFSPSQPRVAVCVATDVHCSVGYYNSVFVCVKTNVNKKFFPKIKSTSFVALFSPPPPPLLFPLVKNRSRDGNKEKQKKNKSFTRDSFGFLKKKKT